MELKNHSLIKQINRAKILNAIRLHAPIARAQIAERTKLDRKSLTNFISEFLQEGIVEEAGKKEQAMGRPFTMLQFKNAAVLGIHIAPDRICGIMMDFHGKIVSSHEVEYPLYVERKKILSLAKKIYFNLKGSSDKKIYGVGVCVPGVLETSTGTIKASVNIPDIEGANLRDEFSKFISEPLLFEDASRSKALAEKWFGLGRSYSEFVCVDLNIGVGMGIINNRFLYKGAGDYAGEIGHIVIQSNGRRCRCGNTGCLETYLSRKVLLEEINLILKENYLRFDDVPESSDKKLEKLLKEAGLKLGIALGAVVNILSPRVIILNGPIVSRFEKILLPATESGIKNNCISEPFKRTKLLASKLENSPCLGAASVALSSIFEVPGHFYV
jgi:predicted NBD/HSP70 family sugar kinase